ncbi:hypothetical protein BTI679_59130 (plasmid) [Bacillus wiedmannii]|nr:hypothetical protein BTI679_59130 [Bacillus wiedmannii]
MLGCAKRKILCKNGYKNHSMKKYGKIEGTCV